MEGLEPPYPLQVLDPKSSVSTNFTTSARFIFYAASKGTAKKELAILNEKKLKLQENLLFISFKE